MRNAFADELTQLAQLNPQIVLLSGDIGNRLFDRYKAACPERFYNCGVAEANMTGMAAGLASMGLRPLTYTITPFVTTRCLEQIRVDICYHRLPVIVVGVGSGLAYASLGATHHACEDIAFLRALPYMQVVCPADPLELRLALRAALAQSDPVYLRLGKKGEPTLHTEEPVFTIGKSLPLRAGHDLCILATGPIAASALQIAETLQNAGISVQVDSFHTLKPLDQTRLEEVFQRYRLVVTLEEHSLIGGLGSAVAEWYCDQGEPLPGRLLRLGTPDQFLHEAGEQAHYHQRWGLTPEALQQKILTAWNRLSP
jgi:transketolase